MRHDNFIPAPRLVQIRTRGRLPHWEVDDAIYFVTFRLADALPHDIVENLRLEREQAIRDAKTSVERSRIDAALSLRIDRYLDRGYGSCLLREHGQLVANALKFFDGQRYALHAWCVMPNHVHVLVHMDRGAALPRVLHSWKSYTAHEIGRGTIWEAEYFDRVVRGPRDYSEMKSYIHRNPSAAGLRDWPWVG